MKIKINLLIIFVLLVMQSKAQQFINKGTIEFEVITNEKKKMPDRSYLEDLKATMPTFKTAYYNYSFTANKSIYKFDHYDETKAKVPEFMRNSEDLNEWYTDFSEGITYVQKSIWGTPFNLKDSIKNIHWKLSNERRKIAGFDCRKAVGIIMDSVYVFAFYTDEILISGGPCTLNGLPGMILGVTIPRLYTSILATKLMVNDTKESVIKPILVKKFYTPTALKVIIDERLSNQGNDNEESEDQKNWNNQLYWNAFL